MRTTAWLGLLCFLVFASGAGAAKGAPPPDLVDSGPLGYARTAPADELSPERRREIEAMLAANVAVLRAEGRLPEPTGGPVLFRIPLEPASTVGFPDPWIIAPYVDHDPAFPDHVLDFNCGTRTYDREDGYNHAGTDILTWPWPWKMLAENQVMVVAAADGVLIGKEEGNPDQCGGGPSTPWNAAYLQHADGTITWYGHMKAGSVTPKEYGEPVAQGEYLGIVGSSGFLSPLPHVHFEVHDDQGAVADPYAGPCSTPDSRWIAQQPHVFSKVLRMTTGLAPPANIDSCVIETPNEKKDFTAPATIFFTLYFRDLQFGQQIQHQVFDPSGNLSKSWTWTFTAAPIYDFAWWWVGISFAAGSPQGTYTWRATTMGVTTEYPFNIGVAPAGRVPASWSEGTPLTVAKVPGGGVVLAWGDSCRASDSDFSIYEGDLDAPFYSHARKVCGTGGQKTWTFAPPAAGDLYWLVVPRNATRGGSYGTDSMGDERPEPPVLQRCQTRLHDCGAP